MLPTGEAGRNGYRSKLPARLALLLPCYPPMTSMRDGPTARQPEADLTAEALRLLRDRGSQILNAIDDGVYCLDAEGRTIFVNEAGARMLGYTQRELLGSPQHETIHHHYADGTEFPKEACPIYLAVTEGVQQRVGGDAFWKKNRERLWVDYTAIPLKEGRRLLGAVVTFRDISAQQQADEQAARSTRERIARAEAETARAALAQSEQRYRALVEAVGQYGIRVVPVLNADGSVREWVGARADITEQPHLTLP